MEKITEFFNNLSLKDIFEFILDPSFEGYWFYLKPLFIVISFVFLTAIIWFLLKTSWLKRRITEDASEFVTFKPLGVRKTPKEWIKIIKKLETGKDSEYKLAVIEADSLLEGKLKRIGQKGDTLVDLLEKLNPSILNNIEKVKQAHKTRNEIVHNPDYVLTLDQAKETIEVYGKAFRDLKIF